MRTVLVVGGTGPSGSALVEGLIGKGLQVSILHRGHHEVEFSEEIEHIHADPHYRGSLSEALNVREFDAAICMYGRMRYVAEALKYRVGHFVGIGGVFYRGWVDNRLHSRGGGLDDAWGPRYTSTQLPTAEDCPLEAESKFAIRALATEEQLFALHDQGAFDATLLRYPRLYGPRQLAPVEWSVVRRIRDGRKQFIVPDGGLVLESRLFSENAARMILDVLAQPSRAAGEVFNCGDQGALNLREWVQVIADELGHSFELISAPYRLASVTYAYSLFPWNVCHRVLDISKAAELLRYRPLPARHGLAETARWLDGVDRDLASRMSDELGDPFDYEREDSLISALDGGAFIARGSAGYRHPYDHPSPSTGA